MLDYGNKMKNDLQNKVEKTADELADKTRHAGHVAGEKVQHVENRMQEKVSSGRTVPTKVSIR